MLSKDGMRWRCPDPTCNWSMVAPLAITGEPTPRCVCGAEMKKAEVVRVFNYLDFLRGEDPVEEQASPAEE